MKGLKLSLMVLTATLLALGFSGMAYAFHSGGVAECGGCHSMHNPSQTGTSLLKFADASSTCLDCHQKVSDTGPTGYHVSTDPANMPVGVPPQQRGPAGDFGWVKKTYTFVQRGSTITEPGQEHGHNIVAGDKGYVTDSVNTQAPGGSYLASNLGCNSCHNPHGKYRRLTGNVIATSGAPTKGSGSYYNGTDVTVHEPDANNAVGVYRLLHGGTEGGVNFPGVPAAKVPSTYNRTEASTQTRVAYGFSEANGHTSWGKWCASCHQDMHTTSGRTVHPVDAGLGSDIAGIYNNYVKTGTNDGSFNATTPGPYTTLVPFAVNNADYAAGLAPLAMNNNSAASLAGPANADRVTCLSCHRAHASGWPFALRWNMEGTFITINGAYPTGSDARGRTAAELQGAYYDRPATYFATYQRVLCNKCHAKD